MRSGTGSGSIQVAAPPLAATPAEEEDSVQILDRLGFTQERDLDNKEWDNGRITSVLTCIIAKIKTTSRTSLDEALRTIIIMLGEVDLITPATQVRIDELAAAKDREAEMSRMLERLQHMTESEKGRTDEVVLRLAEVTGTAQGLEASLMEAAAALSESAEVFVRGGPPMAGTGEETEADTGPRSFAQAVARTPARHVDVVARTETISRQVVLGRADAEGADPFRDLTEKELIVRATMAVELLTADGLAEVQGIKFLHARKTVRGGSGTNYSDSGGSGVAAKQSGHKAVHREDGGGHECMGRFVYANCRVRTDILSSRDNDRARTGRRGQRPGQGNTEGSKMDQTAQMVERWAAVRTSDTGVHRPEPSKRGHPKGSRD
jgi:hypothetical protein